LVPFATGPLYFLTADVGADIKKPTLSANTRHYASSPIPRKVRATARVQVT
jgi:hypothetical protein